MQIIITETQKELLDYNRLSPCIKRRLDLPLLNEKVIEYVDYAVNFGSVSTVINLTIDYLYSIISDDVEVCWGDESYYQFSTGVKRFLTSRYEDQIKDIYEEYYRKP
jgi:hypothetical protein